MTSFQRDALLSGWPSFPRKRESISVSESRNLSYYWCPEKNRIYLLTLYGKSVKDDLTLAERKVWKRVVEEIDDGQA